MNFTALFLLVALLVASASIGFWLGRQSVPVQRHRYGRRLPTARPAAAAATALASSTLAPVAAADHRARRRRDIDARLQDVRALRLARENADPWRAPAVDRIAPTPQAVCFADTTVESHPPSHTQSHSHPNAPLAP